MRIIIEWIIVRMSLGQFSCVSRRVHQDRAYRHNLLPAPVSFHNSPVLQFYALLVPKTLLDRKYVESEK